MPAKVLTTRYRTSSGFWKHCNKRVESRHADQPPAAEDVNRLAKRIGKHARGLTGFLLEKDLPGENNAAERAIRRPSSAARSAADTAATPPPPPRR